MSDVITAPDALSSPEQYSVTYEPSEANTDPWRCQCGSMTFVATGVRNPNGDGYTLTSTRCARCGTAIGVTKRDCN